MITTNTQIILKLNSIIQQSRLTGVSNQNFEDGYNNVNLN